MTSPVPPIPCGSSSSRTIRATQSSSGKRWRRRGPERLSSASSGISEALERAREGEWDVVLLNLSLPDAHELSGARRLHVAFPHLPIVVLTSLDDDRVAARAVAEGAQDYLLKGQIEPSLLVRSIRYAIERHQHAERTRLLAEERAARIAAETALAALRESESRFRAVLDQVQDYAILVLDPKGLVASWSTGARLLKGWSPEEILGRSFESFLSC